MAIATTSVLAAHTAYRNLTAEERAAFKEWMGTADFDLLQSKVQLQMPMQYKLVAKSNYDRDYWDEYEKNPCPRFTRKDEAQAHADYLNNQNGMHAVEFWTVQQADYVLKKGSDQL